MRRGKKKKKKRHFETWRVPSCPDEQKSIRDRIKRNPFGGFHTNGHSDARSCANTVPKAKAQKNVNDTGPAEREPRSPSLLEKRRAEREGNVDESVPGRMYRPRRTPPAIPADNSIQRHVEQEKPAFSGVQGPFMSDCTPLCGLVGDSRRTIMTTHFLARSDGCIVCGQTPGETELAFRSSDARGLPGTARFAAVHRQV